MQLLIRGGRVVDPAQGVDDRLDLLIQDGKILRLGRDLAAPDAQILNADGLTAAPGLVDIHVHLREPGFEAKETVSTGCAAAARGGVTTPLTRAIVVQPPMLSEI